VCVRHEPPGPNSHPFEDYLLAGSAAILCTGGADVIERKHGLSTEQVPVSAYVGSSKNLKDLKMALGACEVQEVEVPEVKASGQRSRFPASAL